MPSPLRPSLRGKNGLSVVMLPITGVSGVHRYYRVQIPVAGGSQTRTFLLSRMVSCRLWKRYLAPLSTCCSVSTVLESNGEVVGSSAASALPGEGSISFQQAVVRALIRKHNMNDIIPNWIAPSSLYKLWLSSCHVSTELFADCFNESGVLSAYCSSDLSDKDMGALGRWEDVEASIEGAAGNPPFDSVFIANMMRRFEDGVHGSKPYCRVVVLPLGERCKVVKHLNGLTSEGEMLLSTPVGCFPFMNEQVLLSRDHAKPKPGRHQSVGIFVWVNRQYLLKYRVPWDIEDLYLAWVEKYLYKAEDVLLHKDAFMRAFPAELRSRESLLHSFVQQVT